MEPPDLQYVVRTMDEMTKSLKVVIVNAHYSRVMGGSEIQCHQIADALSQTTVDVKYLAIGGVASKTAYTYDIVDAKNDPSSILKAILSINPDLVYWRYNKKHFSAVIPQLKKEGIPIVFSISHVHDLQPFAYKTIEGLSHTERFKRRVKHILKGFSFAQAFRQVDGVVCNNRSHLDLIKHKNKKYIPNSPYLEMKKFKWPRPYVVWVGNLKHHKQPELFIKASGELAHLEVDFLMVGAIQQSTYDYVKDEAATPENFHYLGGQDINDANGVIANALFLIHTCKPEGFPNVFLQAWGFAKPTISLAFDPAGLIAEHDLGSYSGSYERLLADIALLTKDDALRQIIGKRAQEYVNTYFHRERNVQDLVHFANQLMHGK